MQTRLKTLHHALAITTFCFMSGLGFATSPIIVKPNQISMQSTHLLGPELQPNLHSAPTIMLFWASWCHRCSSTFGELATLAADNPGLKIIALSVDEDKNDADAYLQKHSAMIKSWPNIHFRWDSNHELKSALSVQSVPTVVLINKDGTLLARTNGHLKKLDLFNMTKELASTDKGVVQ